MPEYNYNCPNCNNEFAVERKVSEYNPHEVCPKCGESADRSMKNFCNGNYIVNMGGFYGKTSK